MYVCMCMCVAVYNLSSVPVARCLPYDCIYYIESSHKMVGVKFVGASLTGKKMSIWTTR